MKKVLLLFAIVILAACNGDSGKQKGPLSEDEIVDILADYHFAQSYHELKGLPQDTMFLYTNRHFYEILEEKGIDPQDFKSSFDWYLSHPDAFHELYNKVITTIDSTAL